MQRSEDKRPVEETRVSHVCAVCVYLGFCVDLDGIAGIHQALIKLCVGSPKAARCPNILDVIGKEAVDPTRWRRLRILTG